MDSNETQPTPQPAPQSARLRFIEQVLSQAKTGRLTGLLLGQLDAFNRISATFGQQQSDTFCADYTQQLRMVLPPNTPVIRLSERRFAILLPLDSMTAVIDVAQRLAEKQPPQLHIGDDTFLVDVTLGIAVYPTHADNAETLFRRAELALNDARQSELTFEIYRPDSTQQQAALWKFASDLDKAVQANEFEVFMQPQINIETGAVAGAEALVRWRQESGRLVSPADFIPIAERSGSVVPITWFVFEQVASTAATWTGLPEGFTLSVNVSARVLDHPEFRNRLATLKTALEARKIADMAHTYYVPFAPHCVVSPIGTMASAHVCAAVPNFLVLEWHWIQRLELWKSFVKEGEIIDKGWITVPDRPGIGVEMDEVAARKAQIKGTPWFEASA